MSVASDVAERNGSHVTWALKKCDFYSESNQEPLHGFNQRRDIRICGLNVGCTKAVDLKHPAPPPPPRLFLTLLEAVIQQEEKLVWEEVERCNGE